MTHTQQAGYIVDLDDLVIDDPDDTLVLDLLVAQQDQPKDVEATQVDIVDVLVSLTERMDAIAKALAERSRPAHASEPAAAPPDPLLSIDNVLSGLSLVLERVNDIATTLNKREERESTISFDQTGRPARIRRSDGTELTITYDTGRREISLRGR